MDVQQPMKMAAAEALYNTQNGASFSLLTIGNLSGQPVFQIRVPHLLSLIADLSWNGQVVGINQMQASEVAKYGAGNYAPVLWLTYWSFRAMVGAGILMIVVSAWGVWLWWRKRLTATRWFLRAAVAGAVLPIIANASGWIFTEAGRQPWIVYGLMQTARGVSTVGGGDVALTTAAFVAVYTVLAVLAVVLVLHAARHPFDEIGEPPEDADLASAPGLVY
jgi:cytochrome d ubiquinol oxidase subunit I